MAKLLFPLRLVTVLLGLLSRTVFGVALDDIFIVQSGSTHGGCDAHYDQSAKTGTLDQWLDEINFALSTAIDGIDEYNTNPRVRKALDIWFGIHNGGSLRAGSDDTLAQIDWVGDRLKDVQDFLSFADRSDAPGQPRFPLHGNRYLFCGSDFLTLKATNTPAQDWQAQNILDEHGNVVNIAGVPSYAEALAADPNAASWWSGDRSPINGYYFAEIAGSYCDIEGNLGLTAVIRELEADITGTPTVRGDIESVIICPFNFDNSNPKPVNYSLASGNIVQGTNLKDVVPKSATFLHEAFHVVFGVVHNDGDTDDHGFLEGDEFYDMIELIKQAKNNPQTKAQRNPENYVYFVTHMFYLLGTTDDDIRANWDFAPMGRGRNRIVGATDQLRNAEDP